MYQLFHEGADQHYSFSGETPPPFPQLSKILEGAMSGAVIEDLLGLWLGATHETGWRDLTV
jgi:hypothetical protein